MCPRQHGPTAEFLAVVRPDGLRQASCSAQPVQHPRQWITCDRAVGNDGDGLVRRVIDNGQALDGPSFGSSVEHNPSNRPGWPPRAGAADDGPVLALSCACAGEPANRRVRTATQPTYG